MIKAEDLTVIFIKKGFLRKKRIRALDGFSLNVERGDIFGLLGPNGAGKSTAMYCFLGLIRPNKGNVTIFGQIPEPGSKMFERIAYVPEEPHYHLYLTIEEAIRYYASLYMKEIPNSRIQEAIERVGLSEFKDLRMEKCSKGMKQKVGIATCLLNTPEILFLDEPTRGLDPIVVREFRNILLEVNGRGTTILINSHILSEIEMICNRVAIIDRGRVVVQDELRNLMNFDPENYSVEFDKTEEIPGYITHIIRSSRGVKGEIPTSRLRDFFDFASQKRLKIYECSLKRASLEETFFKYISGEAE
jgi:ABC-2 type transport system ATP-binding protein